VIIFLDLDGVIYDNKIPLHRYNEPSIFDEVELIEGAVQFVKQLQKIAPVIVLSKTFCDELHDIHEESKIRRVNDNLGIRYDNIIILPPKVNKNIFAYHNHILIDDYGKNCTDWIKAGGRAIQFNEHKKKDHVCCLTYEDTINTIRNMIDTIG